MLDHDVVMEMLKRNGYEDKVTLVQSIADVDTKVYIIIHDCASLNGFVGGRFLEALEARDTCLEEGGILIPNEHRLHVELQMETDLPQDIEISKR